MSKFESESFEQYNRYYEEPWDLESMIDFSRFGKNLTLPSLPQIGLAFQVPDLESKFLPKLFQACSNLRYFLGFDSYSFNPFTKQISQCCRQGLKFPESRSVHFNQLNWRNCIAVLVELKLTFRQCCRILQNVCAKVMVSSAKHGLFVTCDPITLMQSMKIVLKIL